MKMKANEIRKMSAAELDTKLADLKKDLMMTRANDLVMANATVAEAEAKEEAPAKPKRTRKKKVETEETAAE